MALRLQMIIIILSLLHPTSIYAKDASGNMNTLNDLLAIHLEIVSGDKSHEDVQKNGTRLVDETFQFIQNPKNKKILQTSTGQDLLRHQVMLGNYLAVKSHFEKCIKDKRSQRDLNSRVLDSALKSMKNTNIMIAPCSALNGSPLNFMSFNNQIMKVMKTSVKKDVNENLSNAILANSARAIFNLKYKFDPKFLGTSKDIDNVAKNFSSKLNRNELSKVLNNYAQKIKTTDKKLSYEEIRTGLNLSIEHLKTNKTPVQLLAEIQTPAGALLLTPTLRDREKPMNLEDIKSAIYESEMQILDEKKDTLDEKTTEGLVKINPFATGEMLLAHPEYAGIVCDAINTVNSTDTSKEKRDRYFKIGSAVLGGALLLTGIGAIAGAYIITGSLTAGLVAGTVASTVLMTTTAAGVVAGVGSALYEGQSAYQSHQEMLQLKNAFLTNNGDAKNIDEASKAFDAYKESRTSAMISFAGAGLSVINFGQLFSMAKLSSKAFGLSEIKASSKILEILADSNVAKKIKDATTLTGEFTQVKVDTFLYQLAKSSEAVRIKILELLKDQRFTPKDLQEMMEEALKAAKKCT